MPRIYRSMEGDNQKPRLGASATTLGVRPEVDIPVDAGTVHPGTGGMSVSPSLQELPPHRIPERLRSFVPNARGKNTLIVWRMGDGAFAAGPVAERLQLRPDPAGTSHGFVEPEVRMSLSEYQEALHATRDLWEVDES
jgi:hypothetical protein